MKSIKNYQPLVAKKTMMRILLTLSIIFLTYTTNGQKQIKILLEDGMGIKVPITFQIKDTLSVNSFLNKEYEYEKDLDLSDLTLPGSEIQRRKKDEQEEPSKLYLNKKHDIKYFIELGNLKCMFNMKYRLTYKPLPSIHNSINYNKEKNVLEIFFVASAKNSYGGIIEELHLVTFKNNIIDIGSFIY